MTTLAYSRLHNCVSADTQFSFAGDIRVYSSKFYRADWGFMAVAGGFADGYHLFEAIDKNQSPNSLIFNVGNENLEFQSFVWKDKVLYDTQITSRHITLTPCALTVDGTLAMGTGAKYALMAMHLGKSPEEAIKLTSLFDNFTNNIVETMELL